jgi:hypothetical protein
VCDQAETCTGASGTCPANGVKPSGATCRSSTGACDVAEVCDGTGTACPADSFLPSTTVCRSAAGLCDVAETCTGASATCPTDVLAASGVVCRSSAGVCDVPESCDGVSSQCPPDTGQPDGDGDGVCDLSDDCPNNSDPSQADTDGDGIGDACDPCNNFLPVYATRAKITIVKLVTPPGDDRIKFTGIITVPDTPFIDPVNNDGVRILLHDSAGNQILDTSIPPGSYDTLGKVGWKVNGTGTAFTYRNAGTSTPLIDGIYKVGVKKSTKVAGQIKFTVGGRLGNYAVIPGNMPLTGTFVLDAPYATTNQCGDAVFQGPLSGCTYIAAAGAVKCK